MTSKIDCSVHIDIYTSNKYSSLLALRSSLRLLLRLFHLAISIRRCCVQRMCPVIANTLDYAQALGSPFAEQQSVAWSEVFRTLDEAECHCCTVACADELAVKVNDCTSLRHGAGV